jgi:hypothetical protein
LDPADDSLYVPDGAAIRRVTPSGEVTLVLGPGSLRNMKEVNPRPGTAITVPAGRPCLNHVMGLARVGDTLLISDHDSDLFNLRSRRLENLVGSKGRGDSSPKPGLVGALEAHQQAAEAADLGTWARALAVDGNGSCLALLVPGKGKNDLGTLVHLDLADWPAAHSAVPAQAAAAARPQEAKEPAEEHKSH